MCFYITFGSILPPFSHQSACFPAPFSSLFRSCSAKGALWAPFPPLGSILVAFWYPFGSLLAFGTRALRLAPLAFPFGRLWHAGAPFGSASAPFRIPLASFVSLLSLSSLNSPIFRDSPHLPLTFRIYILCAASRGPATALNHGNRYENSKSYPMSYVPGL